MRPKSEIEPAAKPKIDSEQLPPRPKSVEVDSVVVKNSKERGKLFYFNFILLSHISVGINSFTLLE